MKTFFVYLSFFTLVLFSACTNEEDYYDPSSQTVPDELKDLTVPPGFDWATSSTIDLSIEIDDQYNGQYYYRIQVFDENPIITADAVLLSEGIAKANEPFIAKISYAKSLEYVYILQIDPTGKKSVNVVPVSGQAATASLSKTFSAKNTGQTKAFSYTAPVRVYPTPTQNTKIITGTGDVYLHEDVAYIIPAGQTFQGRIINDYYKSVFLYVEGTWKNTASDTQLNKTKLIIQNGGKYTSTLSNSTIKVNGDSKVVVATGGIFNSENNKIDFYENNENSQIINNSLTFSVQNITDIKEIYNYGVINVSGTITSNTSGVIIANEGSFTVANMTLNGGQVYNNCKFIVTATTNLQNDVNLNIGADRLFRSKELLVGANNKINLESRAILDITNELKFTNSNSSINGPASGEKALAKLKKMTINNWTQPSFGGYLQIESSNYPVNKDETGYNVPNDIKYVNFVPKGQSTIKVPSNDCNDGGNNVDPGTPGGGDTKYPLDVVEGTTYTYTFEDNYPNIGDYDMNDFVLDVNLSYTLSSAAKVSKMVVKSKLRAVGASKRLAAAFQLDGVLKENVASVTRTDITMTGDIFPTTNGVENGQQYAVIPIVDNAHAVFGLKPNTLINTLLNEGYITAKGIDFQINFKNAVDISTVSVVDMLNFFIVNGGYSDSDRKEVHLRGYKATNKSTDISAGKNYSTSNFVYAIRVPKSLKYPIEYTRIMDAYPNFKSWVNSGGMTNADWYNTPIAAKIYSLEK